MIDISFEIGGRKVNPNQIGDALEKAVLQEVADSVKKALLVLSDVLNTGESLR